LEAAVCVYMLEAQPIKLQLPLLSGLNLMAFGLNLMLKIHVKNFDFIRFVVLLKHKQNLTTKGSSIKDVRKKLTPPLLVRADTP